MASGLLLGSLLNTFALQIEFVQTYLVTGLFHVIGSAFINSLKMLVVPLVTFSLICSVCGIGDIGALGRVGIKAFSLYPMTTAMAITLALCVAITFGPGEGGEVSLSAMSDFTPKPAPPLTQIFINLVPSNPISAFAEGNMLQIIFFVILFSIAILMAGEAGQGVARGAEKLNAAMMQVVTLVMEFAPIGVFCLMVKTFAEQGIGLIRPMIGYFSIVIGCLLIHALGTMSLLLVVKNCLKKLT